MGGGVPKTIRGDPDDTCGLTDVVEFVIVMVLVLVTGKAIELIATPMTSTITATPKAIRIAVRLLLLITHITSRQLVQLMRSELYHPHRL